MGCGGEGEGEASPAQSSSVCVVTTRSVRSSLISCLCAHCALLHGKLRYCDAAEKVLSGAKMSTLSCQPAQGRAGGAAPPLEIFLVLGICLN